MSVMNINSSCINTLDEERNTPVSLENTTFSANLTNASIFGSCLYEYLSNCTMNISTYSCETAAHPVAVDVSTFNFRLAFSTFKIPAMTVIVNLFVIDLCNSFVKYT